MARIDLSIGGGGAPDPAGQSPGTVLPPGGIFAAWSRGVVQPTAAALARQHAQFGDDRLTAVLRCRVQFEAPGLQRTVTVPLDGKGSPKIQYTPWKSAP